MNRETELRLLVSEYQKLASELAEILHKGADSLERGELLVPGVGRKVGATISALEAASTKLLRMIEKEGVDISNARTVEDLAELCDQLGSERWHKALGAIRYVTASEKKYAAPLEELQDRAAHAVESLSQEGGRLSEESRRTADQALAVLDALYAEDLDESELTELGVSDTIVLGLTSGKYSFDESADDEKAHARQQEIMTSVNQVLEDSQKSAAPQSMDAFEAAHMIDDTVRPLSKLRNSKPNAQRFLSTLNACGSLADIVAGLAVFDDVLTPQIVVGRIRNQYDEPLLPDIEKEIRKAMRQLVRHGILAAYRVEGKVLYVLTRFAFESMKLPEVQRAMKLDFPDSPEHLEAVAREEMPVTLLVMSWLRNSMQIKLDNWLRKETGRTIADIVDMDTSEDEELGLRLPEGYTRAGERFVIRTYELPRFEQSGPVLYVSATDDIGPFNYDDVDGSLLLVGGELYERRDGAWVLLRRTSAGRAMRRPSSKALQRPKRASRPRGKRKK